MIQSVLFFFCVCVCVCIDPGLELSADSHHSLAFWHVNPQIIYHQKPFCVNTSVKLSLHVCKREHGLYGCVCVCVRVRGLISHIWQTANPASKAKSDIHCYVESQLNEIRCWKERRGGRKARLNKWAIGGCERLNLDVGLNIVNF